LFTSEAWKNGKEKEKRRKNIIITLTTKRITLKLKMIDNIDGEDDDDIDDNVDKKKKKRNK